AHGRMGVVTSGWRGHALVGVQHAAILAANRDAALGKDVRRLDRLSVVYCRRYGNDASVTVHMTCRVCWGTGANDHQKAKGAAARKDSGRPKHGHAPKRRRTARRLGPITVWAAAFARTDAAATPAD